MKESLKSIIPLLLDHENLAFFFSVFCSMASYGKGKQDKRIADNKSREVFGGNPCSSY